MVPVAVKLEPAPETSRLPLPVTPSFSTDVVTWAPSSTLRVPLAITIDEVASRLDPTPVTWAVIAAVSAAACGPRFRADRVAVAPLATVSDAGAVEPLLSVIVLLPRRREPAPVMVKAPAPPLPMKLLPAPTVRAAPFSTVKLAWEAPRPTVILLTVSDPPLIVSAEVPCSVKPPSVLVPVRVSAPPVIPKPPVVPRISPAKMPLALLRSRPLVARLRIPEPDRVVIERLTVVAPETSRRPLSTTPLESEMEPLPDSPRVPAEMVVRPV